MSKIKTLRQIVSSYGYYSGLLFTFFSAVNTLVRFQVLEIVTIAPDDLDSSYLDLPAEYSSDFLTSEQLDEYSQSDSSLELPESFLNEALSKGDSCYAVFHDRVLASYGWYSSQPTEIDSELTFCFDPDFIYMYKGLTRPEFRGKRLHAIGMSRALLAKVEQGSKGIISYVERTNFASLKSCYRMGYRRVGSIYLVKLFGRFFFWNTPGCRLFAVSIRVN